MESLRRSGFFKQTKGLYVKLKLVLSILFLSSFLNGCGCSVVKPGQRGVKVFLGEVTPQAVPEGLVWHAPILTNVVKVSVQQTTSELKAECYSSDLQQVEMNIKVLYRIPESQVVTLYQKYSGDVFGSLVAPRVQESLKEVTALKTAENIVKEREKIKADALALAKGKVGELVEIVDIVIENETLSKELETAIESKMVQQQEAAKAEFLKQKARVEAETALIKAQGEANAIRVRSEALSKNPEVIQLMIAEKWDGKAPLVVGNGSSGANLMLPIGK